MPINNHFYPSYSKLKLFINFIRYSLSKPSLYNKSINEYDIPSFFSKMLSFIFTYYSSISYPESINFLSLSPYINIFSMFYRLIFTSSCNYDIFFYDFAFFILFLLSSSDILFSNTSM